MANLITLAVLDGGKGENNCLAAGRGIKQMDGASPLAGREGQHKKVKPVSSGGSAEMLWEKWS
jgi:hypothetical protein